MLFQHEDSSVLGQQERAYLEEERLRVLARVDELKTRVTDLEQQIQESRQEVRLNLQTVACVMCPQSTCTFLHFHHNHMNESERCRYSHQNL